MTNHPNRSKNDAQSIAIDAALKTLLEGHQQYRDADYAGRRNIRRNIAGQLGELWSGHTAEQLVEDYRKAFHR